MHHILRFLKAVALLSLAAMSCQPLAVGAVKLVPSQVAVGPQGPPQGDRGALSFFQLSQALSQMACTKMFACCTSAEIFTTVHQSVSDEASCVAALSPRYVAYVQHITQSVQEGRMAYDGEKAHSCLHSLQFMSCSDFALHHVAGPVPHSDCDEWLQPRVSIGGICREDNECVSSFCQGRTLADDGSAQDGTCQAAPGLGQVCETLCAAGLYCDDETETPVCVPALGNQSPCQSDDQCQSGICAGPTPQSRLCRSSPSVCLGSRAPS